MRRGLYSRAEVLIALTGNVTLAIALGLGLGLVQIAVQKVRGLPISPMQLLDRPYATLAAGL